MIRQFCPHCFRPVELPDDAAGTTYPCPQCGKGFPVPGRYAPAVDPGLSASAGRPTPIPEKSPVPDPTPPDSPPQPPPGFIPPPPAGVAADPVPGPAGGTAPARGGVSLSAAALDWFPAACFTLILLLTFFSWVGIYPGGGAAYSQSPWGMLAAGFSTDHFSETVLKLEQDLDKQVRSDWVMLPYLLGLLAAVAVAWADRLVRSDTPARAGVYVPAPFRFLNAVWPHRFPILAGLAIGLLALLLIQAYAGFSLETALQRVVRARTAADAAAPPSPTAGPSPTAQESAIRQGMQLAQYRLQTTTWFGLAVGTHVVAVVAAGLRLWLYRRGTKPLPRVWWAW